MPVQFQMDGTNCMYGPVPLQNIAHIILMIYHYIFKIATRERENKYFKKHTYVVLPKKNIQQNLTFIMVYICTYTSFVRRNYCDDLR